MKRKADFLGKTPSKKQNVAEKDMSSEMESAEKESDKFCWKCHRVVRSADPEKFFCPDCPRSYHNKCFKQVCECKFKSFSGIQTAIHKDDLKETLRHALYSVLANEEKISEGADYDDKYFYNKYMHNFGEWPECTRNDLLYEDGIIGVRLMMDKVKFEMYNNAGEFFQDAKWMFHNSVIINSGDIFINVAADFVHAIQQELSIAEICAECYVQSRKECSNFLRICREPHPLVWAKVKGYPYWPAKCLRVEKGQVDVRFFGTHDRSVVPAAQVFKLSRNNPGGEKKSKQYLMAMDELKAYIELYESEKKCAFHYFEPKTPLIEDKTKSKKIKKSKSSCKRRTPFTLFDEAESNSLDFMDVNKNLTEDCATKSVSDVDNEVSSLKEFSFNKIPNQGSSFLKEVRVDLSRSKISLNNSGNSMNVSEFVATSSPSMKAAANSSPSMKAAASPSMKAAASPSMKAAANSVKAAANSVKAAANSVKAAANSSSPSIKTTACSSSDSCETSESSSAAAPTSSSDPAKTTANSPSMKAAAHSSSSDPEETTASSSDPGKTTESMNGAGPSSSPRMAPTWTRDIYDMKIFDEVVPLAFCSEVIKALLEDRRKELAAIAAANDDDDIEVVYEHPKIITDEVMAKFRAVLFFIHKHILPQRPTVHALINQFQQEAMQSLVTMFVDLHGEQLASEPMKLLHNDHQKKAREIIRYRAIIAKLKKELNDEKIAKEQLELKAASQESSISTTKESAEECYDKLAENLKTIEDKKQKIRSNATQTENNVQTTECQTEKSHESNVSQTDEEMNLIIDRDVFQANFKAIEDEILLRLSNLKESESQTASGESNRDQRNDEEAELPIIPMELLLASFQHSKQSQTEGDTVNNSFYDETAAIASFVDSDLADGHFLEEEDVRYFFR